MIIKKIPKKVMFSLITLVLLILVGLIFNNPIKSKEISKKTSQQSAIEKDTKTSSPNNTNIRKVQVINIIDGDTITIKHENNKEDKLRLIGVNAPEKENPNNPYYIKSTDYTKKNLLDKNVYIEKDVSEYDQYGRILRYVWLENPEKFDESEMKEKLFNAKILLDGYAHVATYPPDVKYAYYFNSFQNESKKNRSGFWNPDRSILFKD